MNTSILYKQVLFCSIVILFSWSQNAIALPKQQLAKKQKTEKLLDRKAIEKKLGRKLKLGERLALWFIKKKIKKQKKRKKNKKLPKHKGASVAFVFSLLGLMPFAVLFFTPVALILGISSLIDIAVYKKQVRGRLWAWLAIIISLLTIATWIVIFHLLYG